jgi:hypothetical protein
MEEFKDYYGQFDKSWQKSMVWILVVGALAVIAVVVYTA